MAKSKKEAPDAPLVWCYMTYDTNSGLVILNESKKWAVLIISAIELVR